MNHVYVGILAGGSGERLWPLSRTNRPKQLIPFVNNQSLLEQTINRVLANPLINKENVFLITNAHQASLIDESVKQKIGFIIEEPAARNTAPAILLACQKLIEKDPLAVVAFLPADHYIPDVAAFNEVLTKMIMHASTHREITLLGLKPRYAATGFGYIQISMQSQADGAARVVKFHEKPNAKVADFYMHQEDFLWNMGIFAGQVKIFLDECITYSLDLFVGMERYLVGNLAYEELPKISIDFAVIEKSSRLSVFAALFEWYDIGNLQSFLSVQAQYSPGSSHVLSLYSHDNLAMANKKVVAFIGVNNLCVVETEDALLIVNKDNIEEVRNILPAVKQVEASLV
jgi:mannose-1-phosphate guanylyltransferase